VTENVNSNLNNSVIDEMPREVLVNGVQKPSQEPLSDTDKLEEDLLKDLDDDDQEDDLESVGKEFSDLLAESVLEVSAESIAVVKETEKSIEDELEDKLLEDDEVPEIEPKKVKDLTEVDAAVDEIEIIPEKSISKPNDDVLEPETKAPEISTTSSVEVPESSKESPAANETSEKSPATDEIAKVLPVADETSVKSPAVDKTPEISGDSQTDATKSPDDDDALLVACDSPKESQPTENEENQQDDMSETSSTPDETPEESSDEKAQNGDDKVEESKVDEVEAVVDAEKMDVDEVETESKEEEEASTATEKDKVHLCIVMDTDTDNVTEVQETPELETTLSADEPKEMVPLKLKFMKRFSTAVGKVSRPELEEMLIQKITESIMFCSENTELRARLEKQEKLCETFKKRLDNVVKQYNDLQMIHTRVMKDLKDRPDAPITPVKITRAVGLQVYQPMPRGKTTGPPPSPLFNVKSSNKRPMEVETPVNGKSPENSVKRKKRITPLRPTLSSAERAIVDAQEAKEEQTLRTNVSKNIGTSPAVTVTPVSATNGGPKKPNTIASSQSIDLTDDLDEGNSPTKSGPQTPQPPALVAIRAANQASQQRNVFVVKPPVIVPANSPTNRVVNYRSMNLSFEIPRTFIQKMYFNFNVPY
jgi:hypothetical protein